MPRAAAARLSVQGLLAFAALTTGLLVDGGAARVATRAHLREGAITARGRHWIVHVPAELAKLRPAEAWATAADSRLEAVAARLGVAVPAEPLHAFFYASTESKLETAGDDEPFTLRPERREIHWLVTPDGEIPDPQGDALLLLQIAWGPAAADAIAGAVARYAAGTFHSHPLAAYASRITHEEVPYPLSEVLEPGGGAHAPLSPLVADALGGAWVEHLRSSRGPGVLRTLWSAPPGDETVLARALGTTPADLEKDWQIWLAGLPSPPGDAPLPRSLPFLRGISFSHEIERAGYGSDTAAAQLARMQELGATAVAIVPYAFTRAPTEPSVRYRGTDESDARLIRTFAQARHLGLRVMLKPQLWAPRRFTGDIVFTNDGDFDRWLADYRRWMLHEARLAALERVDLLVIGTELGGVTAQPHQAAAWRALIRDVRRVDSGPLTYAANWAKDFETLSFWDDLDVLGLNMYYPLAGPGETPDAESPRVRDLRAKLAAFSRRHGKPVVFTEVGYAASALAAVEPWKEDNAPADPAMQARCYQVVFEAFYREPWLAGLFWWKWPSHGRGGLHDDSFNPLGKPALQVLERWYGRAGR
jgi:hypothetical protein